MTLEIAFVLALFVAALVLFAVEVVPVDEASFYILAVLVLTGILTPMEAARGFSNKALLTLACMFVLAGGLIRTGVLDDVAKWLLRAASDRPRLALGGSLAIATGLSAFVNNTPVVIMFIPVLVSVAAHHDIAPSKLLIPLSFLATAGGSCTVIGTSTNLLVSGMLEQSFGMPPFGFFETGIFGLAIVALLAVYLAVAGRRLLPARPTVTGLMPRAMRTSYITQVRVGPHFRHLGRTIREMDLFAGSMNLIQVIRENDVLWPPFEERSIESGDVWILDGKAGDIHKLKQSRGIQLFPLVEERDLEFRSRESVLIELLIPPTSLWEGKRLKDLKIWSHHQVNVLGLQRRGRHHLREQMEEMTLQVGDIVLALSPTSQMEHLRQVTDVVLLEGIDEGVFRRGHRLVAAGVMALVIAGMVLTTPGLEIPFFKNLDILAIALGGVAALLATGSISMRQAYGSLDRKILMLIVGTIGLGEAMYKTGAATLVAESFIGLLTALGPTGVLSGVVLLSMGLATVISKNAAALCLTPVAVAIATQLDVNPRPFVMAVCLSASAGFLTPVSNQTHLMVYSAGGYRVADFIKVGAPLSVLYWLLATFLLPVLWPF